MEVNQYSSELTSGDQIPLTYYNQLLADMKAQNFDVIRFATYRTACKLRFLQKKICLHLVDIWNVIEAIRENGLNAMDMKVEVNISRIETLVSSIYYQLNKRLPPHQQIDMDRCTNLLICWIVLTYEAEESGKIRVFSVKVALALLCSGKMVDKLRYIFSLICDPSGLMMLGRFADFLKEGLALPASVYESPTFFYSEGLAQSIFDGPRVTVNDFLDILMSDPGPGCLVWMPLFHRLANTENVLHPIQCDGCHRDSFLGFRYKCQRCHNYHLCQDCFWRGRVSGPHTNQHEMKEYTSYKSPTKQLGHSLRKSFRCVPEKPVSAFPRFPEHPERTLNLSHIIPPSPVPMHNGFQDYPYSYDMSSLDSRSTGRSLESSRLDEEHRLIARYAARLADTTSSVRSSSELSVTSDLSRQRELMQQLEAKNREIMREIIKLRKQQEQEDTVFNAEQNPTLMAELRGLRQRKEELESHLTKLHDSRKELMIQLEGLIKVLKIRHPSTTSTPNSSPHSGTSKSPPLSSQYPLSSSRSAPTTPGSGAPTTADSLAGVGGDVKLAFGQSGSSRSLRNDLLVAADSVTNAMSSLVRELNSGSEDEGVSNSRLLSSSRDFETEDTESAVESLEGGGTLWREEMHRAQEDQFLAEIQARNPTYDQNINSKTGTMDSSLWMTTDDEDGDLYSKNDLDSYTRHASLTTDDESYVRTDDDDEGGNTDWEDSMRRWVNR